MRTSVRNVNQVSTSQMPQSRREHMLPRSYACRGVGQLTRIGFGEGHKIFERVDGQVLARHQRVAVTHGQAHGLKVTQAVVRELVVQPHVERNVGDRAHQDRITIRIGFGRSVRADQGARTGPVFHHQTLTQRF